MAHSLPVAFKKSWADNLCISLLPCSFKLYYIYWFDKSDYYQNEQSLIMSKCEKVLLVLPEWSEIVTSVRLLPRQLTRTRQLDAHIVGVILTLLLIYFNFITLVPILYTLLFLLDPSIDINIANSASWLAVYTCAPVWLGQPISFETVKRSLMLFVQVMGSGSLYKKQYNTAMGLLTLGCLSSSIALVLDWARWWQAYPIPMQAAMAITHLVIIGFSAY